MNAIRIIGKIIGLVLVADLAACDSSTTSTSPSPSISSTADAGDAGGDSDAATTDARADARDCTLAADDRDDAGLPRRTIDRTKVGKICFTAEAGTVAICEASEAGCGRYGLPEDPPGTARCGAGCDAITCPGQYECMTGFSNPAVFLCSCD